MPSQTNQPPLNLTIGRLAEQARAEHINQGLYSEAEERELLEMNLADLLPRVDHPAAILAARERVNGFTSPDLPFDEEAYPHLSRSLASKIKSHFLNPILDHIQKVARRQEDINLRHVDMLNRLAEGQEFNTVEIERTNRMLIDQLDLIDRNLNRLSNRLAALSRRQGRRARPLSAADEADGERIWLSIEESGADAGVEALELDYVAFEEANRGPEELVKAKQKPYVELFRNAPGPVLDLGCGRGEFLELLEEAEIQARGVDANPEMVAEAAGKGLAVTESDGLEFLRRQPDGSFGGLFMAQVMEHLSLERLSELLAQAWRVLSPGAVIAAETVNPESLITLARTFYKDPTHLRPFHPEAARFIWSAAGFKRVEIIRLNPVGEEERLDLVDPRYAGADSLNNNIKKLNQLLFGPQDFAVVGRR